ncbi:MarR family winged helix-turn-helix transcriptional regulator [Arthrobacter sp. 35W]|uniref:MarR family winged helix-turn-helix transcriptional regulator n=1 Tax=Arthrobacter sp. 35W TaxID=1132441 RepID=UPI0003FB369E|nr:MarR family winged helix-turn-helix transcriptional regulator [Arthrobacter sp. 35W]
MQDADAHLAGIEHEIMLFSRYHLRPQHNAGEVLERSAYVLMSRLELVDPMTLKELSTALRLDASTIHRQVGVLLRRGLVAYAAVAPGEVARRITPTEEGLAELAATRSIFESGLGRVVEHWPAAKRGQFLELLLDFNKDVERLEGAPWPRRPAVDPN